MKGIISVEIVPKTAASGMAVVLIVDPRCVHLWLTTINLCISKNYKEKEENSAHAIRKRDRNDKHNPRRYDYHRSRWGDYYIWR